ncbi:MAG: hypothetical protein ACRELD_16550, partial [Longimicrobiales bacterium]
MGRKTNSVVATFVIILASAGPALAGPPWISVEYPANPYDRAAPRDALLLVHTYHHARSMAFPLEAVAEGVVAGQHRSVTLTVRPTARPGVWAVSGALPSSGQWVVKATLRDTETNARATALIGIAAGRLVAVSVPSRSQGGMVIPRPASRADVDAVLSQAIAAAPAAAAAAQTSAR